MNCASMKAPPDTHPPGLLKRLDDLVGNLNVLLAGIAIALACFDCLVFVIVTLSDGLLRQP